MTEGMGARDVTRRVESAVRAVLPRSVRVKPAGPGPAADFLVNGIPVQAKWVGEGWLRDVRPVVADRRRRPDLVVARRISPGAREALSNAGIGWLDETGAAEFVIGPIIVSRTGQPEEAPQKHARWTPSVLAVSEALLCGARATVAGVGEATGLSSASCTTALRVLTDLGLLGAMAERGRDSARHIVDFDRLLDAYASAAAASPPKRSLRVGVTWSDIITGLAETGRIWNQQKLNWATTGAAASLLLAPLLTSVGAAEVFVEARTTAELRAAAEVAGLRPIDGGRLTLLPFPTVTAHRLATEVDGVRVAPWPRVYADLRKAGVRGEEAAQHLREVADAR
jgi:hypothetical protein